MNDVMGKRIDEIVDRIVKSCITDLLYESQGILHQSMQDLGKEITSKLMAQPNCDNFYIDIDDNHYNIPFDKIFIVIVNGFGRGFRGTNFASGYNKDGFPMIGVRKSGLNKMVRANGYNRIYAGIFHELTHIVDMNAKSNLERENNSKESIASKLPSSEIATELSYYLKQTEQNARINEFYAYISSIMDNNILTKQQLNSLIEKEKELTLYYYTIQKYLNELRDSNIKPEWYKKLIYEFDSYKRRVDKVIVLLYQKLGNT